MEVTEKAPCRASSDQVTLLPACPTAWTWVLACRALTAVRSDCPDTGVFAASSKCILSPWSSSTLMGSTRKKIINTAEQNVPPSSTCHAYPMFEEKAKSCKGKCKTYFVFSAVFKTFLKLCFSSLHWIIMRTFRLPVLFHRQPQRGTDFYSFFFFF